MRLAIALATVFLLAACTGTPPKPAQPVGEYRPVNRPAAQALAPTGFDFSYHGDISGVLDALFLASPNFKALPPAGQPVAVPISVNLKAASLETALAHIGEQGGQLAEVVFLTTKQGDANQVFIRFKGQ